MTLHSGISWAVDGISASFTVSFSIPGVSVAVWVLVVVQVVVSQGFLVIVAVVVGDDVAVAVGGSGCERRGWKDSRGGLGRPGIECRHSRVVAGGSGAGGKVVVVVDNNVGVVDDSGDVADGGCVGVVSSDVAGVSGDGGLGVVSPRGVVCIRALTVEVGVVQVLKSVILRVVGSVCMPLSILTFCSCVCGSTWLLAL